ncbi:MAG: hypothetical protein EBX36_09905, partial [Planctomycetia bacterium]|nr:hypothetical protein [Planctomycetia bacterium]
MEVVALVTVAVPVAVNMPGTPANSIGAGRSLASDADSDSDTVTSVAGFMADRAMVVVPVADA